MKVVCEGCSAKYQVPDARVAGKKLKIRCKRCGETVLIRGDLHVASGDDGATTVAPSTLGTGQGEWHVSVDGQVSGPFAMPELLSWLATSAAGWDAFVWREGFGEWIEARACDEIVTAAGGAPTNVVAATGTEDELPTRMFQGPQSLAPEPQKNEIFPPRASVAPASSSRVSASSAAAGYAKSIASQPPRTRSSAGSLPPATPSYSQPPRVKSGVGSIPPASMSPRSQPPRLASSPNLQRSTASRPPAVATSDADDSVLFSTHNLRQVALSGSQPPSYSPQSQPGFASGEGSGLIDIRALAQLARQQQQSMAPRAPAMSDDGTYSTGEPAAPLFAQTGAFNHIDSLAPMSRPRAKNNAPVALAIFGGFGLLAAAAFAAIVITRAPTTQAAQPPSAAPTAPTFAAAAQPIAPEAAPAVQPTAAAVEPTPAPTPDSTAAAAEDKAEDKADEKEEAADKPQVVASGKPAAKRHTRGARTASEDKKAAPAPEEKSKTKDKKESAPVSLDEVMLADKTPEKSKAEEKAKVEEPEEKPAAKSDSKGGDIDDLLAGAKPPQKSRSIDDLLDGAVAKKPGVDKLASEAKSAPKAESDLEESPSRDQVLSAMRGIESSVRACAQDGVTGTALVHLEVSGDSGKVSSSDVSGVDDPMAGCIAKAAKNAKFPRFAKPSFSVKYPYRFK
jgi:predicted Zn finger-like uncharacterized protein